MNRKENIVHRALELFNRDGIASVSVKEIAKQMGISDGNIRYYYRTKEDLVIAILESMKLELTNIMQSFELIDFEKARETLKMFFALSYQIVHKYRCLYLDQVWLHHHMKNYRTNFQTYVDSWRSVFKETFRQFLKVGIFKNQYSERQYKLLFEQLYIFSDSWILYYEQSENRDIEYYIELAMSILTPYWVDQDDSNS